MALTLPNKDSDEVLDYVVDWTLRLESGDTISTSTWEFADTAGESPPDLTIDSETETAALATVWLSGGTEGLTYELTNRIVTAGGRTMDQTVKLKIRAK